MSRLHLIFREPDFQIGIPTLDLWRLDQFTNAEASLTAAMITSNTTHYLLASRALVRTRLREWDTALVDAEMVLIALIAHTLTLTLIYTEAIDLEPSVIGYIAKSVALVGKGERHKAYRACDIAFARCHPSHATFLLLIRVCICRSWPTSRVHIP